MSEKATATAAPAKTSHRTHGPDRADSSSRLAGNPFAGLQQTLGNQGMLQLLAAGTVQAKLRVSQPGDADEVEADRAAEKVVAASHAPKIQRKCACDGGTPCAKCATQDDETIHRSVATPLLRSSKPSIQRAPAQQSPSPAEAPGKSAPRQRATHPLIVEDDAEKVEPHQMRKSQFIALLRTQACATADAVLMSVGKSTKGCPYIEKWLGFYEKQNSQHVAAALQKYAPETATARSAHEAIRLLLVRVQKAAVSWAKTGKVEGLPPEMASEIAGQRGLLDKVHDFATTGVAGAIFGFIGGKGNNKHSGSTGVMRKAQGAEPAPSHDATAVKAQLGTGHSLDSRVESQMSSAFGHDFSGVRVHTDSSAANLSSDLQARAFTVGNNVAFASGEYQPGTLVGDALIAHELAHVVQQSGGAAASGPQRKSDGDEGSLEQDADRSAAGALTSIWTQGRGEMRDFGRTLVPSLKSGLRLSRCKDEKDKKGAAGLERLKVCVRPVQISDDDGKNPTALPSFADMKNIWGKCCIDVSVGTGKKVSKTAYRTLDESPNDTPTAEESALFADAGGGGGCVSVFVADNFSQAGVVGKDVSGGGGTYDGGKADAKVVVVEGVEPTIVAHEMGHAMGYGPHEPPGTVMEVTANRHDQRESTKVAAVICDQVRKFVGATATGKKDCNLDT